MKRGAVFVLLLVLWEGASRWLDKIVFPGPVLIFQALLKNYDTLFIHGGYSLYRMGVGILLALLAGVPLGIVMGYYRRADRWLSPLVYLAGPVPKIALLPLVMLFFGIGELSKLFIIFIIMVFQVVLTVRDGVRAIPYAYFIPHYTARVKTRWIFWDILLPAAWAYIFTAVRIGIATAISVLFFAETFGTRYGMGFFIMDSWVRLEYARMYLGILGMGIMGLGAVAGLDRLEKRIHSGSLSNRASAL